MKDEIKEIREYIKCPQFGDDYYGKWGALRLDQRKKIKDLLDYITNLQEENERVSNLYKTYEEANDLWIKKCEDYKQRIDKAIEYINTHYLNANEPELLNILNGDDE